MAKVSEKDSKRSKKSYKSLTPEGQERRLISKAYDLVEQRLDDGTATAQEVCHFLKLGTQKEALELEKIKNENELIVAKKDTLETEQKREELLDKALEAFSTYAGHKHVGDEEDEEL